MEKRDRARFDEMKKDLRRGAEEFVGESPAVLHRDEASVGVGGMKVAVIVADGFEQVEFDGPVTALRQAGVTVEVLAPDSDHLGAIKGVNHFEPGPGTRGDRLISEVMVEEYDGLLIPGGLASPDTMRQSEAHLNLARAFLQAGKPVASICHGPWVLGDADVVKGRTLTSWPGIRKDLERAGAHWVDQEVVVDGNLITSRKPDDVPAFSRALLTQLATTRRH